MNWLRRQLMRPSATARPLALIAMAFSASLLCSCATAPQLVCRATVPDTGHIDVHGNVYLDNYPSGLLHRAFDAGDTAIVTIAGRKYRLKVVTDIHDAAPGSWVLHFRDGNPPYDRFAVINGAFADRAGLAKPVPAENGKKPRWAPAEGVAFPVAVEIAKQEKSAGRPRFEHYASRSNDRADYPNLTDAEFANFRAVSAPAIASGILYRSSSPVDPSLGRSRYADAALASSGVKTVWNMADTVDDAASTSYPSSFIASAARYTDGCSTAEMMMCFPARGFAGNIPRNTQLFASVAPEVKYIFPGPSAPIRSAISRRTAVNSFSASKPSRCSEEGLPKNRSLTSSMRRVTHSHWRVVALLSK